MSVDGVCEFHRISLRPLPVETIPNPPVVRRYSKNSKPLIWSRLEGRTYGRKIPVRPMVSRIKPKGFFVSDSLFELTFSK